MKVANESDVSLEVRGVAVPLDEAATCLAFPFKEAFELGAGIVIDWWYGICYTWKCKL